MSKIIFILAFLAWSLVAQADVEISGAWAQATAPGQEVGVAFISLASSDTISLESVTSPVAKNVKIHRMLMDNGFHLILLGLKRPLKDGDVIEISLTLKDLHGKKTILKTSATVK